MSRRALVLTLCLFIGSLSVPAQQVADSSFSPPLTRPAYPENKGPVVAIDEAHHNFHTIGGRYLAFANLLRRDGYQLRPSTQPFSDEDLKTIDVLVIANALSERNQVRDSGDTDWSLPTPSAFTPPEIAVLRKWVQNGGSLFLIVDHMPFPGCNGDLASAFGIRLSNGFAQDSSGNMDFTYHRSDGGIVDHLVFRGRSAAERIDSVRAFTGEAIQPDSGLIPLLRLKPGTSLIMPSVAWEFGRLTPSLDASGWYQGALKIFGKGRIAVFGEAAMFSAQLAGHQRHPVGMNDPQAPQNAQFLLNVVHWLTGALK